MTELTTLTTSLKLSMMIHSTFKSLEEVLRKSCKYYLKGWDYGV